MAGTHCRVCTIPYTWQSEGSMLLDSSRPMSPAHWGQCGDETRGSIRHNILAKAPTMDHLIPFQVQTATIYQLGREKPSEWMDPRENYS